MENCICILHNLSYRLDAEVPNKYTQLNHMARSVYMDKTLTGCFNSRSGKMEVRGLQRAWKCAPQLPAGTASEELDVSFRFLIPL